MVVIPFTRKRNIKGLKKPILFSKTIQLSSEVKYLGLTLNKGLTWKKRLHKVINKAYKGLLDTQGHVQKNSGTETNGNMLDIHCGREAHSYLCCHCMEAQS
jgi:hypothetical protein